jgi:hypothetical protein
MAGKRRTENKTKQKKRKEAWGAIGLNPKWMSPCNSSVIAAVELS